MLTKILNRISCSLMIVAVLANSIACSGDGGSNSAVVDGDPESVGVASQAVNVSYCANASSTGCWEDKGPPDQAVDFSFFNIKEGGKVFAEIKTNPQGQYVWNKALFRTAGAPLGYASHPSGLPANIRSITTFSNGSYGTAMMLAEDGKIYSASGAIPPPTALNGVDWATVTSTTPKNAANQTLCLREIEYVRIPAPSALAANALALGCDGKLYHSDGGVWKGINTHPAYQTLPTDVTYTHFSRMGSELGATFVTSANRVWLAGRGSFNIMTSTTTWEAPIQLPLIKNSSGATLSPLKVGGRFAVTTAGNGTCVAGSTCNGDSDRVYWYDFSAGTWKRFIYTLPWYPQQQADIGYYPYYDAVSQVGGADFALHHAFSWIFRWRKP